ncbi:MAG: MFS transporter [Deltaproteobacteria bacterium]|nr:MFS transporter [Deltaproteobacteria bacterium]
MSQAAARKTVVVESNQEPQGNGTMTSPTEPPTQQELFGHPAGLFVLFFAEMWERFSYYGMRALLVFYMTKGFLGYGDTKAYGVYGAYCALVYMTPFLGGMIADRVLGQRRGVIMGGTLMAAGHLLMTIERSSAFYGALALLIVGNGFFKPNIGTIVGRMYGAQNKDKRDGGFTIFYMGVNLGAALSPLLCGLIGERYGWHYGFGLATLGMLIGLAIFVAPNRLTQMLIGAGSLASAASLIYFALEDKILLYYVNAPIAIALLVAAVISVTALEKGGVPKHLGLPPQGEGLFKKQILVILGTLAAVPVVALLVSKNELAGQVLNVFGLLCFAYVVYQAMSSKGVERHRLFVTLPMFFFSMLFWAFFEQAGSSMNNFADRNVDRVTPARVLTQADVGTTLQLEVGQAQLGHTLNGKVFTLDQLDALRKDKKTTIAWPVDATHIGMMVSASEVPASVFQAANPAFILIFGLLFTWLWGAMARRKIEPSTPVKFAMALFQLGLGFGCLWYGAGHPDQRGMVGVSWLLLAYLLQTTGEICLSPVGLSMISKLSPARLVSTMMGAWYVSTAFGEYLASLLAKLTGVTHGGEDGAAHGIPAPIDTVHVYGDVFGRIALAALISAALLLALTPLIKKWMHTDLPMTGEE